MNANELKNTIGKAIMTIEQVTEEISALLIQIFNQINAHETKRFMPAKVIINEFPKGCEKVSVFRIFEGSLLLFIRLTNTLESLKSSMEKELVFLGIPKNQTQNKDISEQGLF